MRTVVAASCAGTAASSGTTSLIFGSLTQVIAKTFFAELGPTAGVIASLALFGVGFAFRPLGALIFGGLGDRIGRKGAFLITVTMMGGATFAIGLLPTFAQVGQLAAPLLLILLRIVQGTALGGQYGGAKIAMSPNTPRRIGAAITPPGCRPRPRSGFVAALTVIFDRPQYRRGSGLRVVGLAHPVLRFHRTGRRLDLDASEADREPDLPEDEADAGFGLAAR